MKIGIIGAMEVEVETLKGSMNVKNVVKKASMEFYEGTIENTEVVVVRSGIGKVNAGICAQILADIFGMDVRVFGYKMGVVPQLGVESFVADADMREKAKAAIKKVAPDIGVFEGRVASGDQFISGKETKDRIIADVGGMCAEMEGAAIAQACYLNNIPYLIIRAISDKADGTADVDYPTFEAKAAKDCAALTMELIKNL